MTLGLRAYADLFAEDKMYLMYLNAGGAVLLFLIGEIYYQTVSKGEDPWVTNSLDKVMSEQQFDEKVANGKMLWILDDMVLDLSTFVDNHPGGAFAIEQNVGRDISKFFYGAYSLDGNIGRPGSNNNGPYAHSNVARKIANKFAIAVLAKKDTHSGRFAIKHSET